MKISFVIPSKDSACWLAHAVQSCLQQTHKDIEVIVVNDGSKDSTADYLSWQATKDARVRVLTNDVPQGRSAARNAGNDLASGEVICVLDADDVATPQRAALMAEKFKAGAEFVYGSAWVIDAVGRKLGDLQADVWDPKKALETKKNRIVHSTVAYSKEFSKNKYQVGRISDLGLDDWELELRAHFLGVKLDFVPQVLCAYRQLSSAITATRDEKEVEICKAAVLESFKCLT